MDRLQAILRALSRASGIESLTDHRLGQLCRTNIDGVPLDLAARLLPWRSRLRFGLGVHLHLHAALQRSHAAEAGPSSGRSLNRRALLGLVDSLQSTIRGLRWKPRGKGWATYYDDNSYTPEEFERKARLVAEFLKRTESCSVWDLGANTGYFSQVASELGLSTIAFDLDPACVERTYLAVKERNETKLLPLILDLFNPSPPSGWLNQERSSIFERGTPDLVLALALDPSPRLHRQSAPGKPGGFLRSSRALAGHRIRTGDRPPVAVATGPPARDSSSLRPQSLRSVFCQILHAHHLRTGFTERTDALLDAPARLTSSRPSTTRAAGRY